MKKVMSLILTVILCVSLATPSMAASSGMSNFQKSNTYAGQFADMSDSYWGTQWAAACYEYGLMNGTGSNTFTPLGVLSIAEAIAMADRVHEIYTTGQSTITNGTPWYQPYVDYAIANGIIYADSFADTDYTAPAPRYLMAQLLYNAIPTEELTAINTITSLPDVPEDWLYAPAIYTLYEAGVLTGGDRYGTFSPANNITRAEAAAILARLAVPALRQEILLLRRAVILTAGGSELLSLNFPQASQITADGMCYQYADKDNASSLEVFVSYEEIPGVYDASIADFMSPEEVSNILSENFQGAQLSSTLVRFGDVEAYLTELVSGTQFEVFDRMSILSFLWGGNLIMVALGGVNCDTLYQDVFDSLAVRGQPLRMAD